MTTCIDDHYSEPGVTNREVQFSDTVQFPQRSMKRSKWVPWTFIIDQMNVPEVYYWTFGRPPPPEEAIADGKMYISFQSPAVLIIGSRHVSLQDGSLDCRKRRLQI